MPYTAGQLTSYFTVLSRGASPDSATSAAISTAATQDASGQITDAQALLVATNALQIRATTDVAVSTYALFTGATPSQAGIDYLVNNPGTGYNTSYYNGATGTASAPSAGGFNLENRYYNAAINLAAASGSAGNAAFVTAYGSLTVAQAIQAEYNAIIGVSAVGATAAAAAIASITSSLSYFQAVAAQRAGSVSQDIAVKAIIAGYILEEGIKADVGLYAKSLDGFNAAFAMGTAVFNTNLVATYGPGGGAFNPALSPLFDGQTLTSNATTVNSIGVVANGTGTFVVNSGTTIAFTGDIASNNGQAVINVNGAANSGSDVLGLTYAGQSISTPASVIAAGVETINLSASTSGAAPAGSTLSVDIQDAALQVLNISGNESVAYSAPLYALIDGTVSVGGLMRINAAAATAPVNIDLSSMPGTSNATAVGGVSVTGTTGADTFSVRNFASITGNGGNDTIVLYQPASISSISSVTDDHAGVMLGFAGLKATAFRGAAITATSVQNGLDQAAAAGPGVVSWFQVGGDTYVVADNSTATTFQAGNDFAIRLVGTHALGTSTVSSAGVVVLGG